MARSLPISRPSGVREVKPTLGRLILGRDSGALDDRTAKPISGPPFLIVIQRLHLITHKQIDPEPHGPPASPQDDGQ